MPCQPDRSLPLNRAVKPFGGCASAAVARSPDRATTGGATTAARAARTIKQRGRDRKGRALHIGGSWGRAKACGVSGRSARPCGEAFFPHGGTAAPHEPPIIMGGDG